MTLSKQTGTRKGTVFFSYGVSAFTSSTLSPTSLKWREETKTSPLVTCLECVSHCDSSPLSSVCASGGSHCYRCLLFITNGMSQIYWFIKLWEGEVCEKIILWMRSERSKPDGGGQHLAVDGFTPEAAGHLIFQACLIWWEQIDLDDGQAHQQLSWQGGVKM